MLEIHNVDIMISTRFLVKSLSFSLNKGDKLAIIGEEGNGKTTLLKSLLGQCEYAEITGIINFKNHRIGYLEQSIEAKQETVYHFLFLNENEYYQKINKLYKYLKILYLNESILNQMMNTLSGGEKVKIGILKLLLEECDIFFLDEPTNDLDIETLEWLEQFINQTEKPILYVSHDETLLSNTANMILHLEQLKNKTECKYTILKTDYNTYIQKRAAFIQKNTKIALSEKREFQKKQEKLKQIMQKVEYQQNTITRADPHGAKKLKKKMHSLKSQEKKMNQTERTEIPDIEEGIHFYFDNPPLPKTKLILKLELPELKIQNKILSKNIKLEIMGNTHVCIVGKNGTGKSTLMKIIEKELQNRKDISVGYMPQNYEEILKKYEYVLDFLVPSNHKKDIMIARQYLGNMNFTKEEMTTKISNLSNGTKAKLFLVKLVLEKCNVLILDEPTRNVSPLSNPIIRNALKQYHGTIISVSHDRKYIEEVIDSIYLLKELGIEKIK